MVYKFVVLSDEDESFVREFEFLDSHTLLDFHNMLQNELEYDKSQMASFFMMSDNWEKEEEFTLFDMGNGSSTMDATVLEDIIFRKNQKLFYLFDFFNNRGLFVEYIGEAEEDRRKELPVCTNAKGVPPKQVIFSGKSRTMYNNIVVADDDDDDEYDEYDDDDEIDDLFLSEDDDDSLSEFESLGDDTEEEEI